MCDRLGISSWEVIEAAAKGLDGGDSGLCYVALDAVAPDERAGDQTRWDRTFARPDPRAVRRSARGIPSSIHRCPSP